MSHIERLAAPVETAALPLSMSLLLWLRGRALLLLVTHHVAVLIHHLTHLSHHLAHLLHHALHPFLAALHHAAPAHHAALAASHHVALFVLHATLRVEGWRGQNAREKSGSEK